MLKANQHGFPGANKLNLPERSMWGPASARNRRNSIKAKMRKDQNSSAILAQLHSKRMLGMPIKKTNAATKYTTINQMTMSNLLQDIGN
eukprot:1288092-Amphidinium_carterae.1